MLISGFPRLVVLALAGTALSQKPVTSLVSRRLTEYVLPVTTETHELARVPGTDFVLLSQMSNSQLVKIQLDAASEAPIAYQAFPMGKNNQSGLHGVWPSKKHPGMMWLSLQWENKLLLVDPGTDDLSTPPTIIQTIDIPEPGNGPHCVFEIGDYVWAGLKVASKQTSSFYVFSASLSNTSDTTLYPCLNSPVFIAQDPATKLVYATQDASSSIMRINTTDHSTSQLPIPPSVGVNPVGLTNALGGGLWFTLAGNATGGTGTFGRINPAKNTLTFLQLKSPLLGTNAGLLHLADAASPPGDPAPALWLLSTSLLSNASADALIRVTLDADLENIVGEEYISIPTQNAMTHRVLTLDKTVMVSELHTFTLAQLAYNNTVAGEWLPAEAASNATVYDEAG
ncbi:hypothetical protein QBC47DRAFT_407644 [Echria macrotheca]|uniref:Uncharacterized protein n=1 Tax=Echria macrotheca TaxID=438768 RepID=A0AAJ0F199_9PEZI|nr:hypothetical protein QBC47DRAFT_407644 [Echria macrotheca]